LGHYGVRHSDRGDLGGEQTIVAIRKFSEAALEAALPLANERDSVADLGIFGSLLG
jgi:hypothetical protein